MTRLAATMSTGETFEVDVINPDYVRFDMERVRRSWPEMTAAPFLGLTFLAWSAAKRQGAYSGDFDDFSSRDCVAVVALDEDEDEPAESNALGKFTAPE